MRPPLPLAPVSTGMGLQMDRLPVTTIQHASIAGVVKDAVYVGANDAAAQLFGFAHPDDMLGSYMSMLHHPRDLLTNNIMAMARLEGYRESRHQYVTRIRRTDGTHVYVEKNTATMQGPGGVTTWTTILRPVSAIPLPPIPLQAWLRELPPITVDRYLGQANVAMVEEAIRTGHPVGSFLDWVHRHDDQDLDLTVISHVCNISESQKERQGESAKGEQRLLAPTREDAPAIQDDVEMVLQKLRAQITERNLTHVWILPRNDQGVAIEDQTYEMAVEDAVAFVTETLAAGLRPCVRCGYRAAHHNSRGPTCARCRQPRYCFYRKKPYGPHESRQHE